MPQPTTDEMNDITVMRELEKMKKWIIDYTYGRTIKGIKFTYGSGEHINRVTLTITFIDDTSVSSSFDTITISNITTETVGEITYLVVTMTNGNEYRTPLDVSNFVTLDGNQTISGDKLFTGEVGVRDITHPEGEEQVQETNEAVNERFFKINATERIDSIEDEIGDVGQEGTIRGDISTLKNDMTQAKEDIVSAFDDIRYLDENKQAKLVGGTNIKNINGHDIMGGGNLQTQWGELEGSIADQNDLQSALDEKQPNLVSGQNLKTINGVSLLGSGDVPIATGGTWGSIGGQIGNQDDLIQMFNTKQDKLSGYWKVPTINELLSAVYMGVPTILALKYYVNSDATSWTSPPTNVELKTITTSYYNRVFLGHPQVNFNFIITTSNGYRINMYKIYANNNTSISVSPIAFNGGGFASGSGIDINSTNYTQYIDLSNCLIWITE